MSFSITCNDPLAVDSRHRHETGVVQFADGGMDVVSGTIWREGLHDDPPDHIVVPDQP